MSLQVTLPTAPEPTCEQYPPLYTTLMPCLMSIMSFLPFQVREIRVVLIQN